jgi:5-methylcytosine-specific restriction protein A
VADPLFCPLCEREVPALSDHHLVPKSRGGRDTEPICLDCHRMIHVLFDNKTLERELGTVEALRAEPRMAKYLAWISKRPGGRRYRARRSRR